jgi:hypothetical protein
MYTPTRDYRFEYASQAIAFIELRQCHTCLFKENSTDYPMCYEIAGSIVMEQPVEDIDDRGNEGIVCTKYEESK